MPDLHYQFQRAWGEPVASGLIRQRPEDFRVKEKLSFTPSGQGDHVYLLLEKTEANTDWVASQLAKISGLKPVDIGYAGLKDRHAVTQQWFSLHMPRQSAPDCSALPDNIRLLSETRHEKKLKTGSIEQNEFELQVKHLQGDSQQLENRLKIIQAQGVPNYFGPQRFGRNKHNVQRFLSLVKTKKRIKRQQKGLYISAARSYLFNHMLSRRVAMNNWNQLMHGDVLMLDGCRSIFVADHVDAALRERVSNLALHPCAVLWGDGQTMMTHSALEVVHAVSNAYPEITHALSKAGAALAHRAMRIRVKDMNWQICGENLTIRFSLISGAYATSVLNEFLIDEGEKPVNPKNLPRMNMT